MTESTTSGTPEALAALATKAYIYGYPIVYNLREIAAFEEGSPRFPVKAPYNQFAHVRKLAGPDLKFVSPNNDTLYSLAMCDVSAGPLVLRVPDTDGRYYVLQFVGAWTDNFAYIGRRATGTAAGAYLLAGPGYAGPVPDGMTLVAAPSSVFAIVGRTAVEGEADAPAVHALQDGFTLAPLGESGATAAAVPHGMPIPDPSADPRLAWWEAFRVALAAFPPPAADAAMMDALRPLGLLEPISPYAAPDPALADALVAAVAAGDARIEELIHSAKAGPTGWQGSPHMFDYNLDHFEIGTIDDPQWKFADRATAYAARAIAARAGLWGNHGYEATYLMAYVDGDGEALDGSRAYEIRLDEQPPVEAFWSLTMYDATDFYLVANEIDRYSIGDRTPGLAMGADGSLTIRIQHDRPAPGDGVNWLPAPAGRFRPAMRLYQPQAAVIDGSYVLPPIRRIDRT